MKKILIAALAFATLSMVSCKNDTENDENGIPAALADSISNAYGNVLGRQIAFEMSQADSLPENAKADFLKGFQTVMAAENSDNAMIGMNVAVNMLREMKGLELEGVKLDKSEVIKAFKAALNADSVDYAQLRTLNEEFQALVTKAMQAKQNKLAAGGDQNPEGVKNEMIAKEYIDNLKQADAEVKTTSTGLTYKIHNPGTGDKPAVSSKVKVNYTGRHLDGSVFDSNEGRGAVEFPLGGVVAGFREGLMMLGKGGKATLYIPGNLGYGEKGMPQGGIAPNEMLVFDVELVDFE